ncbi:hypothetical protein BDU57DRAFT_148596 [Ampelomyces quisqualis]|uniref:Uncharacterized protein n=1 Tax=Ampelomyces quisqualis TaxID=50730 RepID=A0A6A5QXU1_AMPQU|nr:hypothetical protein BDU57DRAFT_148596 [Ampelomyces quisqualis]
MPYLIYVPGGPRPYITNDPRIFMDAKSWNWPCESRPYADSFCKALRREEHLRFESARRTAQLEQCWMTELERRKKPAITARTRTFKVPAKHSKHDSVLDMLVGVKELELDN